MEREEILRDDDFNLKISLKYLIFIYILFDKSEKKLVFKLKLMLN